MSAKVDNEKCTGCAACKDICPVEAITIVDDKAVIDEDTCIDCGQCVDECPTSAITLE
jgi:NAD-dependent dihydropyrimidine dehydrogenase PreA subunit